MSIRSSNLYANHILFCLPQCPTSLKASFCLCSYQFNTSPLLYSTGPCWSPVSLIMSTNYSVQKCASNSDSIPGRTISNSGILMANMSNKTKTLSDDTDALSAPVMHGNDNKAWFSENFFLKEPSTSRACTLYLKIVFGTSFMITIFIMAVLLIYWGAL